MSRPTPNNILPHRPPICPGAPIKTIYRKRLQPGQIEHLKKNLFE